jgi:hypothetical protein
VAGLGSAGVFLGPATVVPDTPSAACVGLVAVALVTPYPEHLST